MDQGQSELPRRERAAATGQGERRRHTRFLDEVQVRYRDLESGDASRWGRTRDLSLGGLLLICEETVKPGTHLALEIHIENETAPLLALGKTLRSRADPEGGFAAGLQFLWVSEEDRRTLQRLAAYFKRRYGTTGA